MGRIVFGRSGLSMLDGSAARFATLDLAMARSNAVFALARETNGEGNAADSIRFKRPLRKRALRAFLDSRLRRTRFRSSSTRAGLFNLAVNWYNDGVMVSNVTATGVFGETRFDAFRRATVSLDGLGNATTRTYDAADCVTSVTDALGNVTRYGYDGMGRVLAITNALDEIGNRDWSSERGTNTTYVANNLNQYTSV